MPRPTRKAIASAFRTARSRAGRWASPNLLKCSHETRLWMADGSPACGLRRGHPAMGKSWRRPDCDRRGAAALPRRSAAPARASPGRAEFKYVGLAVRRPRPGARRAGRAAHRQMHAGQGLQREALGRSAPDGAGHALAVLFEPVHEVAGDDDASRDDDARSADGAERYEEIRAIPVIA